MNEYIYLRAWCRLLGSFFNFIEGKGKTEDLQATGYLVDVYAPHGRNRRRAVVPATELTTFINLYHVPVS